MQVKEACSISSVLQESRTLSTSTGHGHPNTNESKARVDHRQLMLQRGRTLELEASCGFAFLPGSGAYVADVGRYDGIGRAGAIIKIRQVYCLESMPIGK